MSQATILYSAGFTTEEVRAHARAEAETLYSAGFSMEDVDKHTMEAFGMSFTEDPDKQDALTSLSDTQTVDQHRVSQQQEIDAEITMVSELDKMTEVESWQDALMYGFNRSVTGLALGFHDPTETLGAEPTILNEVVAGIGQALGDLPTTVAGAIGGAAVAAPSGPGAVAGAIGGAMSVTEGTRAYLMGLQKRGTIDTFEEAMGLTAETLTSATAGGLMGSTGGLAGGLAAQSAKYIGGGLASKALQTVAQPAVTATTMTAVNAAMEMRLPTTRDLILAGVELGGERLGGFYTDKLAYNWQKHGVKPRSMIEYAKKDPALKEDLISANLRQAQADGGNYTPMYALRFDKPVSSGPNNPWFHTDRNIAQKVADGLNNKNKKEAESYIARQQQVIQQAVKETATEGTAEPKVKSFTEVDNIDDLPMKQVETFAMPADAKWLQFHSLSDPNMVRIYNQYMKDMDPDFTPITGEQARKNAVQTFNELPDSLVQFLKDGKAKAGAKENEPIEGIVGIQMKNRLAIIDDSQMVDGSVLQKMNDHSEHAAAAIQQSISVNESSKTDISRFMQNTYMQVIDRFQSLNNAADIGGVTVPYMAARLLQGTDGLANYWLTMGRTMFAPLSTRGDFGTTRQTKGNSLQSILAKGSKQLPKLSELEFSQAEAISARIKDVSISNTKAQLEQLDATREELGLTQTQYEEAKLSILAEDEKMGNTKDPLNLFRTYIVAKRAAEMHGRGEESGIDIENALAISNNPAYQKAFEAAAQELYAYQHALLKYRLDAGLISKKAYDKILTENKSYIPMHRVLDDGDPRLQATGTYAIKGSTRDIIDPFESIIRQTQYTLHDAERNQVLRLVADQYGKKTSTKDEYKSVGTVSEFNALRAREAGANSEKTIKYRVAGKIKTAEVPYDIYKAAEQLDPTTTNMNNALVNVAASVAALKRATTVLHPNFGNKNFFIDQFSAALNSDSGYRAFIDFGKGLSAIVGHKTGKKIFPDAAKHYEDWLKHGGSSANLVSQDRKYTQEMIDLLLKSNNVHNSVPFNKRAIDGLVQMVNPVNWGKGAFRTLQGLSELSEDATRVGEYMRAIESGANPFEASYRGREVTMDFKRMGASMKALNSMSVFLNARLQGADRSIRQLRAHPLRTINRITAGIVIPSILLAMVREDYIEHNPESETALALREIPQWQKDVYWIVPTPNGIWRIPKPHEYGIPFANPVESFVEHMYKNSDDKNFLSKLLDEGYVGLVAQQYSLDVKTMVSSMIPTIAAPMSDVLTNYNMFTGQPIITASMEKLLPEARYNRNTTELSKNISRLLSEISPDIDTPFAQKLRSPVSIDYMIGGYLGTIGQDLWKAIDYAAQKAGVIEEIKKPTMDISEYPLIKAFAVKFPNAGSESVNKFYEEATAVEQKLATIEFLAKQPNASAQERSMQLALQGGYGSLTKIRQTITAIGRNISYIHFNPDIPPEDKRRYIDTMYLDMIRAAQAGRQMLKQLKVQMN